MRLGDYEILAELGRGTGGVVYRVRAPSGDELALKLFPRKVGRDFARLERELELMRSLGDRSGFVPLLAAGICPEGPFLLMPFLRGGTLRQRLQREPMTPTEAAELGIALARAVGRAHARAIVHRDLKPENVLFDEDDVPHVADLGVAKMLLGDSTPLGDLSQTGEMRGTAAYMPLEQLQDAKRAGPPADVFAIGAIVYEALAGSPPFMGESMMATIDALVSSRHEPLGRARRDVPPALARVIERALASAPEERYADGLALAHALDEALAQGPGRSRLALAVLGVVFALGAVALGVALALAALKPSPPIPSPRPASPAPVASRGLVASPPPVASAVPKRLAGDRLAVAGTLGSPAFRHANEPTCLTVSRDGHMAVIGDSHGDIVWWLLPEGEELDSQSANPTPIRAVALLADGRRCLALPRGQNPVVLDPGGRGTVLEGHKEEVIAIAASPVGGTVATTDRSGAVKIWDLNEKKLVLDIAGSKPTTRLAFGADGKQLYVGFEDGNVIPFQIEPKAQLPTLCALPGAIVALAVSPEGDRVAAAAAGNLSFPLVMGLAGKGYARLDKLKGARSLSFGAQGRLTVASDDGDVHTYELDSDHPGLTSPGGSKKTPIVAAVPGTQRVLYLSSPVESPRFFGELATPGHERSVEGLVPLPGDGLASISSDQTLRIWDLATGEERAVRSEHTAPVSGLALSPDRSALLTTGLDGFIHMRDPLTGEPKSSARSALGSQIAGVQFTPDGRAWFGADRGLGPVTGTPPRTSRREARVLAIEATPDGLLDWDATGELDLMEASTGVIAWRRGLKIAAGHGALASVTGGYVAALETGSSLRLLQLIDGADVWTATVSPEGKTHAVAASHDGRRLVTVGSDVTLLDRATGHVLQRVAVPGKRDFGISAAFSLDDQEVFVGTSRGQIVRYSLRP